jgi:hypothetical protein
MMEVRAELVPCDGERIPEHRLPQRALGGHRLDRLDALDRVDLVRTVLRKPLLDLAVQRPQPILRHTHEHEVERRGGEEDQRELHVVDEHQRDRHHELRGRRQRGHAVLDDELAQLPQPLQPALDVAGSSRGEVARRKIEEPPHQIVERGRIHADGDETEQVTLNENRQQREGQKDRHTDDDDVEQPHVLVDEHAVHDDLGEDGQDHLQRADDEGERHALGECTRERPHERPHPAHSEPVDRRLFECVRVVEQRCVSRPLRLEVGAGPPLQSAIWIGHQDVLAVHVIEHDPVVPLRVHDRG